MRNLYPRVLANDVVGEPANLVLLGPVNAITMGRLARPPLPAQERGKIIIEPSRSRSFTLRKLVNGIRSDILHDAIETGPPQGREVW